MSTQIYDRTTSLNKSWDAPSNHILCGAHVLNTVVQEVLKVALKATELGMEEEDDVALAQLAATGCNVVLKVGAGSLSITQDYVGSSNPC
jgi:hypothetical protein